MILVDSSVWIDHFNGKMTAEVGSLHNFLDRGEVLVGDLVMTEVLQGFKHNRDFDLALRFMRALTVVEIVNEKIALQAAVNHRLLRSKGISIRKTIDTLIATCCIENGHTLLYSDRDFDPFVKLLGMKTATPVIV